MMNTRQAPTITGPIHLPGDVPFRVSTYGDHPDQYVEWWEAPNPGRTLVLLHGGFWSRRFGTESMHPLAVTIRLHGWNVANVEYRRDAGFDALNADVATVLDCVRQESAGIPVVVVGHSAGGHLALLHANLADAVVAVAPITDLVRAFDEGLVERAVAAALGGSPEQYPDRYLSATPRAEAIASPTLVVHAQDDDRVPVAHTREFVERARGAGVPVTYRELESGGHLELVDPYARYWREVREWVSSQVLGHRVGDASRR